MRIIIDDSARVAQWVVDRLPELGGRGFGPCTALGVTNKDNLALMGIVFHDYQPQWGTMQLSMAADSPRWAHRSVIKSLLAYPFEQLGVQKLWAAFAHTNTRAQRLSRGLGFKQEGILGRHFGPDHHAVVVRMFNSDFRRLYGIK